MSIKLKEGEQYRLVKDLAPGDGICGYKKPMPAGTIVKLSTEAVDNYAFCYVARSLNGTMAAYDPYGFMFEDLLVHV